MVNRRGLMLLLLLGGDVFLNPGPFTLNVWNARSIRNKGPLNRSRLHHQIAQCNALVNNDKADYYNKLISDTSHDSQKLWCELHKTLNRVSDATLPSHKSEKSLTDPSASFF